MRALAREKKRKISSRWSPKSTATGVGKREGDFFPFLPLAGSSLSATGRSFVLKVERANGRRPTTPFGGADACTGRRCCATRPAVRIHMHMHARVLAYMHTRIHAGQNPKLRARYIRRGKRAAAPPCCRAFVARRRAYRTHVEARSRRAAESTDGRSIGTDHLLTVMALNLRRTCG